MDVLIIGGGIGGLTAALALDKRGHRVTVAEQSGVISEVGAGLQLSPNAMKVMNALGVSARVMRDAFRPQAAEIRLLRHAGPPRTSSVADARRSVGEELDERRASRRCRDGRRRG